VLIGVTRLVGSRPLTLIIHRDVRVSLVYLTCRIARVASAYFYALIGMVTHNRRDPQKLLAQRTSAVPRVMPPGQIDAPMGCQASG
jgi:hypothetical protein